jgi:hypothetical protein
VLPCPTGFFGGAAKHRIARRYLNRLCLTITRLFENTLDIIALNNINFIDGYTPQRAKRVYDFLRDMYNDKTDNHSIAGNCALVILMSGNITRRLLRWVLCSGGCFDTYNNLIGEINQNHSRQVNVTQIS